MLKEHRIQSRDGRHRRLANTGPDAVLWIFSIGNWDGGIAAVSVQGCSTDSTSLAEVVYHSDIVTALGPIRRDFVSDGLTAVSHFVPQLVCVARYTPLVRVDLC
jgi:hypothetical protein